ncbi:DUF192 domain-containing protein [Oleiharenicola lentus]|uniref:DUF192 domain-containing protein n=1 Tax=Oleiharenicola lentus TaxID=2508720 RepID=UPI003F6779D3
MFSRRLFVQCFTFAIVSLLTACGGSDSKQSSGPKTVDDRFAIKIGDRTVQMQLAVLPDEMQKGLMFRKTMGADEGMLFVFNRPQQLGFWMRNTELALDIGYLDANGELKEIYPMYPRDERSVSSRSRSLQFALEMNQGWFAQNGVKPDAKLDLKALAEALKARNLRPEAFGIR